LSGLGKIQALNIERIRALMESGNSRSLESVQKAITFYEACLNTEIIDLRSLTDLRMLFHDLGKRLLVECLTWWPVHKGNHSCYELITHAQKVSIIVLMCDRFWEKVQFRG